MKGRRVTVVASEILGIAGAGGPATADSLLAIALARSGHEVELLVAPGRDVSALDPEWEQRYADSSVRVRAVTESMSVEPSFLSPSWHVHEALREDPPDVVIVDDWRALGYVALRSRQLGASLGDTGVVLYCHGPARVFAEAARKVPDTVERHGEEVAQRACVELADAVISPSEWLVGWLREHGWPLRENVRVIQNLWESVALGQPAHRLDAAGPIHRLVFFGQLREGKGIRILIDALQRVDGSLLDGVQLVFVGHTRQWALPRITQELGGVAHRLASVRVESSLGRTAALGELLQPGTLALMPSLLENSPYAVAECIEHGIPFLATAVGGTPELVADEDRARVLRRPDAEDFAAALDDALRNGDGLRVRPAREPDAALADWLEVVESTEAPHVRAGERASAELVLVADSGVTPDAGLRDALTAAQAASGADAVTAAVRTKDGVRLFLGDPGALGLIENHYGVVGLIRPTLGSNDSAWPLFTRIALEGGRIVSLPTPLATHEGPIGAIGDVAGEGVEILHAWERAGRDSGLAQLAATLGAQLARRSSEQARPAGRLRRLAARVGRRRG